MANARSVQREEAAARLPRAAQLPSALGLAPIDDGPWPARSLEPEYRDNLRGPRTIIKTIFSIVSIFTVPIAYYFWMGGWDTISGRRNHPQARRFCPPYRIVFRTVRRCIDVAWSARYCCAASRTDELQ